MSAPRSPWTQRFDRLEAALDRFGRLVMEWWTWPLAMFLAGALALTASLVCYPVENDVHAFGRDLMGPCEFRELYDQPCASCGMTRSWVWIARGHPLIALRYNVAGVLLWCALVWGGLVGFLRLVRRDPTVLRAPLVASGSLVTGWIVLYMIAWFLRISGFYPLD
ncbi:MAG: DUF2752 domain-containing protein [Myxococcota bacterium]